MKKALKRTLLILPLVVAVLLLLAYFRLGSLLRTAVVTMGPEILQASVELEGVSVRPLRGKASLTGLVIGNPEGFRTPHAVKLDKVWIELDTRSLRTDTVHIHRIELEAPEIAIEGLRADNLRQLQQNALKSAGATGDPETEAAPPEREADRPAETGKAARKIMIDELVINGGQVNYTPGLTLGQTIVVDLPEIRIEGIGRARGGVSIAEALAGIFQQFDIMLTGVTGGMDGLAAEGVRTAGRELSEKTGLSTNTIDEGLNTARDAVGELLGDGKE